MAAPASTPALLAIWQFLVAYVWNLPIGLFVSWFCMGRTPATILWAVILFVILSGSGAGVSRGRRG